MKIASHHAEAVGKRARIGVEKWLLFDGIALRSGGVSRGNVELAAAVEADFADSGLTFGNGTTMSAGEAAETIVFETLDQRGVGLADVIVQNGAKGGHLTSILTLLRARTALGERGC